MGGRWSPLAKGSPFPADRALPRLMGEAPRGNEFMGQDTKATGTERGFALISAIFLLLMLAALGAFMVTMSGVQQASISQSIISSRVYYGARSGLEWAVHLATAPAVGSGVCAASTNFVSPPAGLDGISIRVECNVVRYCSNQSCTKETSMFQITSTASYGSPGSWNYAERKLYSGVCRSTQETEDQC